MGNESSERNPERTNYTEDRKRDVAAINGVLDQEAAPDAIGGDVTLVVLLKTLPTETVQDNKLIDMVYFARDKHQKDVRWRACRPHIERLSHLDLRNPMQEFDNLAMEMSPVYGHRAGNHAGGAAAPRLNGDLDTRAIEADTLRGRLQAEMKADQASRLNSTPYINTTQLFEQAANPSSNSFSLPISIPGVTNAHNVSENTATNTQSGYPWQRLAKFPVAPGSGLQAIKSPVQGHMPHFQSTPIDPSLTRQSPQAEAVTPHETRVDPLRHPIRAASPPTTNDILDPILDPRALYQSHQRSNAHQRSTQQQQPQCQIRPPAPQQPLSLQAIRYPSLNLICGERVNPDWLTWRDNERKKDEAKAREAEREARLRAEILAEMAAGADVLAYRFREYNEVVQKLGESESGSEYHQKLLANTIIKHDDQGEDARVVRFAKSRWWNYWTKAEKEVAKEAMRRAAEEPLGLWGEMRRGGHLMTRADMSTIRRVAKSYDSVYLDE